jgi:DNA-binding NarL/FixJ family response regulator
MGKKYLKQEIESIQTLISEGLSNREIAARLNRTEAARAQR